LRQDEEDGNGFKAAFHGQMGEEVKILSLWTVLLIFVRICDVGNITFILKVDRFQKLNANYGG
jgi:hypothetical protein